MKIDRRTLQWMRTVVTCVTLLALAAWVLPAEARHEGPLQPVTLQLKWTHQFQFAGYYAAQAQGYYRDEGLAVTFKERRPGITVINEVLEGRAEFGVGNAEVLLSYMDGQPLVVLGAIFQHAPDVLLSRADAGINRPRDLRGKRVMLLGTTAPSIWAMLASQGINRTDLKLQQLSWNVADLIQGETDAINAYLTDQPYTMQQAGVPANIMRPISYGIDFYGDCLITSQNIAQNDPKMVERFARASFKGWEYAMAHPEELIGLIRARYNPKRSKSELLFEAEAMRELILPSLVEMGSMNRSRWEHIAKIYRDIGMLEELRPLDDFLYISNEQRRLQLLADSMPYLVGLGCMAALVLLSLLMFNRRLHRGIEKGIREIELNKESLRQVIDLVPSMIAAKNREGRFLLVNRAMAESLGTTVEALTGSLQAEVHPDKEQVRRMLADDAIVLDTGFPKMTLEEPYQCKDGSIRWLQTTRLPFIAADTDEPAVLSLSMDITGRRAADDALKSSEERFRAIFNQTYQFTGILSLEGTLIQANETSLAAFGIKQADVLGKPFWDTPWWDQDRKTRAWLVSAVKKAAAGETIRMETVHTLSDGKRMVIDFSLKPARNSDNEIIFLIPEGRDITSLKKTEEELRQLNEELELRVADRTRNLEIAKIDLERSLEELKATQAELILSEKLAALGGLVAGVAHEINTPLGIGVTASSFLEEKIKELSKRFEQGDLKRSDLEKFIRASAESSANILTNLSRAAELIKSFKQVAADQSSELPRLFNLKAYVNEILLSLHPKYKRTGHVIENQCPDIDMFSYPGAFMQIITNLLMNALTHAYSDEDSGHIRIGGEVRGKELVFTFSDDGAGIAPEIRDKVFEPFYTTKREQGNTGLGLHIVFNTVTQTLGGTIHFDSSPGKGTQYTITMPLDLKNGHRS